MVEDPSGDRDPGSIPDWWTENEWVLNGTGAGSYRPPTFEDGAYVHEVVADMEAVHDCRIDLLGYDTTYPEDWEVRVRGEGRFPIGRHRDDNGATVYETTAARFRAEVRDVIDGSE